MTRSGVNVSSGNDAFGGAVGTSGTTVRVMLLAVISGAFVLVGAAIQALFEAGSRETRLRRSLSRDVELWKSLPAEIQGSAAGVAMQRRIERRLGWFALEDLGTRIRRLRLTTLVSALVGFSASVAAPVLVARETDLGAAATIGIIVVSVVVGMLGGRLLARSLSLNRMSKAVESTRAGASD